MASPARSGKYKVCPRCEGEGTHTNPAIDGNGITASEMDELGDDFRDDYVSGVYDIPCECCGGKRVVTEDDWRDYRQRQEDHRVYLRESGIW